MVVKLSVIIFICHYYSTNIQVCFRTVAAYNSSFISFCPLLKTNNVARQQVQIAIFLAA